MSQHRMNGTGNSAAAIDEATNGRPCTDALDVVVLGLSLSSAWGNGHATTYRALLRELDRRGHRVTFLERDVPWYSSTRDLTDPPYCTLHFYGDLSELHAQHRNRVERADAVIIGSFVPDGVDVARWVTEVSSSVLAFYDIDTPRTLAKLERSDYEYLTPELIPDFDLYLSFTGGPTLDRLEREFGARRALPLYCSVDTKEYFPEETDVLYDLGYMGTYSDDRQPLLDARLLDAARAWPTGRFVVAGPGYPDAVRWPENVRRIEHLPPDRHRRFYNSQRATLNVTREDMARVGYAPSVRLFEAAACATPIISDAWDGLETFFTPGEEILLSRDAADTLEYLRGLRGDELRDVGQRARARVLSAHTAAHRAAELEGALLDVMFSSTPSTTL